GRKRPLMSDPKDYLWLIPALPLAASAITAAFGPRLLRRHSHWPCILATIGSCILSAIVLLSVWESHGQIEWQKDLTWFSVEQVDVRATPHVDKVLDVSFNLRADSLTAVMLVTVTFIGSWIAIYSVGYMHGDEGYARFFSEVALFIFSMTGL